MNTVWNGVACAELTGRCALSACNVAGQLSGTIGVAEKDRAPFAVEDALVHGLAVLVDQVKRTADLRARRSALGGRRNAPRHQRSAAPAPSTAAKAMTPPSAPRSDRLPKRRWRFPWRRLPVQTCRSRPRRRPVFLRTAGFSWRRPLYTSIPSPAEHSCQTSSFDAAGAAKHSDRPRDLEWQGEDDLIDTVTAEHEQGRRGLRLRTLMLLRWVMIFGPDLRRCLWVRYVLKFDIPTLPCLTVISAAAIMNLSFGMAWPGARLALWSERRCFSWRSTWWSCRCC